MLLVWALMGTSSSGGGTTTERFGSGGALISTGAGKDPLSLACFHNSPKVALAKLGSICH